MRILNLSTSSSWGIWAELGNPEIDWISNSNPLRPVGTVGCPGLTFYGSQPKVLLIAMLRFCLDLSIFMDPIIDGSNCMSLRFALIFPYFPSGYGSIPIDTFLVGYSVIHIHKSQLWLGVHGTVPGFYDPSPSFSMLDPSIHKSGSIFFQLFSWFFMIFHDFSWFFMIYG